MLIIIFQFQDKIWSFAVTNDNQYLISGGADRDIRTFFLGLTASFVGQNRLERPNESIIMTQSFIVNAHTEKQIAEWQALAKGYEETAKLWESQFHKLKEKFEVYHNKSQSYIKNLEEKIKFLEGQAKMQNSSPTDEGRQAQEWKNKYEEMQKLYNLLKESAASKIKTLEQENMELRTRCEAFQKMNTSIRKGPSYEDSASSWENLYKELLVEHEDLKLKYSNLTLFKEGHQLSMEMASPKRMSSNSLESIPSDKLNFIIKEMPEVPTNLYHCIGYALEREKYMEALNSKKVDDFIRILKSIASVYSFNADPDSPKKLEDINSRGGELELKLLSNYYKVQFYILKPSLMPQMIPVDENQYERRVYLCVREGEPKVYDLFVGQQQVTDGIREYTVFSSIRL